MMGITLVLFLAILTRSLPLRWENSTAYTNPVCKQMTCSGQLTHSTNHLPMKHKLWWYLTGPTISDTWDTVVPEAAPRYNTRVPGAWNKSSMSTTVPKKLRQVYKQFRTSIWATNLQSRCCQHLRGPQQPA
jgi:hypothetical protein